MDRLLRFRLRVVESPATGDFEVVPLGDGTDLVRAIDDSCMGLDPDDMLIAPSRLLPDEPADVEIGRCHCGVVGCGDIGVVITCGDEVTTWQAYDGRMYRFNGPAYAAEVERAIRDTSWETPDRTAARLVRERVDRDLLFRQGLAFQWASGVARRGHFSVSMSLLAEPHRQVLLSIPWKEESVEEIAASMVAQLRTDARTWERVSISGMGRPRLPGYDWVG